LFQWLETKAKFRQERKQVKMTTKDDNSTQNQVAGSGSANKPDSDTIDTSVDHLLRLRGGNTYILSDSLDDRRRLTIQVKLQTPLFKTMIGNALDKGGGRLRQRLRDPKATFRVLDLGCGEGLFLPVLAEYFKEQGAQAKIEMFGLDRDRQAITTGQDYLWELGIKNAWLSVHDLTKPFKQTTEMGQQLGQFDLIYSLVVLMHLPSAALPELLCAIHDDLLLPGGVFYSQDSSWVDGFTYPSPAYTDYKNRSCQLILKILGGVDFAPLHHEYLKAAGFSAIETFEDAHPIGGNSEQGRQMLNNFILGQYGSKLALVKAGLYTEQAFDQMLAQEFKEITPELEGRALTRNTLTERS
jgi:SAM-dependent methyltransferase